MKELTKAQRKTYSSMRDSYQFKSFNGDNVVMRSAIQDLVSAQMSYDKYPDIEIDVNGKFVI